RPDERQPAPVLDVPGLLADQHEPGVHRPDAEHGLGGALPQLAGPAARRGGAQAVQVGGFRYHGDVHGPEFCPALGGRTRLGQDRGGYLLVRPAPEGRRPPPLGLSRDRVEAVDRRGRQQSWPRAVVSRLRLLSFGLTEADRAGFRVPVASGIAVDGPGGLELVRLPWWGNWHEALEQA